jgi:hypothetical protein
MDIKEAIGIIDFQSKMMNEPILETLIYMDSNRDNYSPKQIVALELVLGQFKKMFAEQN